MIEWTTWTVIRFTGLFAYLLFSIAMLFGLLRRFSFLKKSHMFFYHVHQQAAWLGFIASFIHIVTLLFDTYEPYTMMDILIPFQDKSIASSIGIVAMYSWFVVFVVADLGMKLLPWPIWKNIHFLVFPAWFMMAIHGFLIGTDTMQVGMLSMYVSSTIIIVLTYGLGEWCEHRQNKRKVEENIA